MKNVETRFVLSAITGFLFVLPFVTLEWMTKSDLPRSNFPIPLFVVMWFFAAAFTLILVGVVRSVRAGNTAMARATFVLRIVALGLIAWNWVGLVIDQMPCFLGATGC